MACHLVEGSRLRITYDNHCKEYLWQPKLKGLQCTLLALGYHSREDNKYLLLVELDQPILVRHVKEDCHCYMASDSELTEPYLQSMFYVEEDQVEVI